MSQIEVQGCDRYVAFLYRAKIRCLFSRPRNRSAADPIDLPSPWILHRLERIRVDPSSESGETNAHNVVTAQWWHVDVQERVLRKRSQREDVFEQVPQRLDLVAQHAHVRPEVPAGE